MIGEQPNHQEEKIMFPSPKSEARRRSSDKKKDKPSGKIRKLIIHFQVEQ